MIFGFGLLIFNCSKKEDNKPIDVQYFKNGDVLPPDYCCKDSLIVTDAKGLNKAMAYIEQGFIDGTDDVIDSTFHLYCRIK